MEDNNSDNNTFLLWDDDEINSYGSSIGKGTFQSCLPTMKFFPANNKNKTGNHNKGCVIVCPGGGYEYKAVDHEGYEIVNFLNKNNINAFLLDYRVYPDIHPAPLTDALRAIEKARDLADKLGYNPQKIGILGFSAGGHLAASAATMWTDIKSRPDAVILAYSVITMGNKYTHQGSRSNLVGENISGQIIDDLSCENRVNKQTPPAFIWHTVSDEAVPVENSLLFADALSMKSIPFELHIFPEGPHGLGLAQTTPGVKHWPALMIDWLKRLGF